MLKSIWKKSVHVYRMLGKNKIAKGVGRCIFPSKSVSIGDQPPMEFLVTRRVTQGYSRYDKW